MEQRSLKLSCFCKPLRLKKVYFLHVSLAWKKKQNTKFKMSVPIIVYIDKCSFSLTNNCLRYAFQISQILPLNFSCVAVETWRLKTVFLRGNMADYEHFKKSETNWNCRMLQKNVGELIIYRKTFHRMLPKQLVTCHVSLFSIKYTLPRATNLKD